MVKGVSTSWDINSAHLNARRIAMDNNTVDRTIRPIALNQKSALFASHYTGAQNWGIITSLIVSTKLNKIEQLLLWKHTAEISLV